MYEETFRDGAELTFVAGPSDRDGNQVFHTTDEQIIESHKYFQAKSITVETVYGQGCRVPWARVVKMDGTIRMVNLALMEEVGLANETP